MHGILLFLSGSCLKTEVFKQLYYNIIPGQIKEQKQGAGRREQ
jgi:hypothetical protein